MEKSIVTKKVIGQNIFSHLQIVFVNIIIVYCKDYCQGRMEQQIPIYFIIAKPRPKHNAAVRSVPGGCVRFIRSMPVGLLPLQLRQLRFHLRDQHLQFLLTFLARVCIHIPRVLFAVDPCRGVSYMVSPKVKYISSPSRSAARSLILSSHL